MKAVSVGDVYFLRSPFHSTVSSEHEKRISYLLGTVSSRPAIVVRPPFYWDKYSDVVVIASGSSAKPAIHMRLEDKYGFLTEDQYNFQPHRPHTIPVGRLGRYIGKLDDAELEELLYAYKWIADPIMQNDKTIPVPPCYNGLFDGIPNRRPNFVSPQDTRLQIDSNMKLTQDPAYNRTQLANALDGVILDVDIEHSISPVMVPMINDDPTYHPVNTFQCDTKIAASSDDADATETDHEEFESMQQIKRFPPSIFGYDDLVKYAGEFSISTRLYNDSPNPLIPRSAAVVPEVTRHAIFGELSSERCQQIIDLYKTFRPMDAYLLGPRLPTTVLSKLTELQMADAAALKRLCCYLRDLSQDEYEKLLAENNIPTTTTSTPDGVITIPDTILRGKEATDAVTALMPYLNETMIHKIPKKLQVAFLQCPQYMIKKAYHGKKFQLMYSNAYARYSDDIDQAPAVAILSPAT